MMFSIFTIIPLEAGAVSGVSYIERSWDGEKVTATSKTNSDRSPFKAVMVCETIASAAFG